MQPIKCKIFLKGFCPKKELCQNSHDIKNCMSGPNCTIKNQCPDRHPPLCKNFVKNTCGFFVGNKFIVFSNCAFFHPVNVTSMRDDYTNTPFHHLPILPPTYQPPLMLTMIQMLLDLQNKVTAMGSNNLKDTGGVESHPVACQQTSDLLSIEEGPPLPAVNIQKEDNSINSSASVSSERITKLEDPVKEKKKRSWWPS